MILEITKFTIEFLSILSLWIAVNYKRENCLTPFVNKGWWVQFGIITIAVVVIKNIDKINF